MSFHSYLKPKFIVGAYHSKPLNWIDRMDLVFEGFNDDYALFHKGLEIWKKYEYLFCGNNIFFDVFENDHELHFVQVSVFNKRLMFPLFDQCIHKFIRLDSSIKDKESLFNLLLHDRKFKEKFYSREDLLGVCLGYGEKNADLFRKMATIFRSLGRFGFTLNTPTPTRFKNLQDELATLERSFNVGMRDHVSRKLLFHLGVGFRVDFSDPETIFLQDKYTNYHKKLTQFYENANFLERTLELIIQADCAKQS